MTTFAFIVSLGFRCRSTRRLRDHFGFRTAFPFDWWITPIDAAIAVLRDWDIDRLYNPRLLRARRPIGRDSWVENTHYRIRLFHEFPRDAKERLEPGWRDAIGNARERTAGLMSKFERLAKPGRPVLFVRELAPDEEQRQDAVAELRAAVLERLPRVEASFLLISPSGAEVPGWRALKVDDPTTEPWSGDPAVWDPALSSLGFRLDEGLGHRGPGPAQGDAAGREGTFGPDGPNVGEPALR